MNALCWVLVVWIVLVVGLIAAQRHFDEESD
jgi:hypothetical protein